MVRENRLTCGCVGAPERIRTSDTRFRKPLLYPLSYEGVAAGTPPSTQAAPGVRQRVAVVLPPLRA